MKSGYLLDIESQGPTLALQKPVYAVLGVLLCSGLWVHPLLGNEKPRTVTFILANQERREPKARKYGIFTVPYFSQIYHVPLNIIYNVVPYFTCNKSQCSVSWSVPYFTVTMTVLRVSPRPLKFEGCLESRAFVISNTHSALFGRIFTQHTAIALGRGPLHKGKHICEAITLTIFAWVPFCGIVFDCSGRRESSRI